MRIAIMQPYFIPYAGYFRLFSSCDVFVIFDCVQFPRRGWVHRNQLISPHGRPQWLTLPVQKCDQSTPLKELKFAPNHEQTMAQRLAKFPQIKFSCFQQQNLEPLYQALFSSEPHVVPYLSHTLREICHSLNLPFTVVLSSELPLSPELRGQDKILEICRHFKAQSYVNAPNGRALYCPKTFHHHGVRLDFLPPYQGPKVSILHRLLFNPVDEISHDIISQSQPIAG